MEQLTLRGASSETDMRNCLHVPRVDMQISAAGALATDPSVDI